MSVFSEPLKSKLEEKVQIGGYYYHYKRNPQGEWNNYLYQVLNIGHHTEISDFDASALVIYRPLYKSPFGSHWACRPLEMFAGDVERDGQRTKRFTLVTDVSLLEKCRAATKQEQNIAFIVFKRVSYTEKDVLVFQGAYTTREKAKFSENDIIVEFIVKGEPLNSFDNDVWYLLTMWSKGTKINRYEYQKHVGVFANREIAAIEAEKLLKEDENYGSSNIFMILKDGDEITLC